MIQIGIISILGVILACQFKSGKAEYGIYISVVISIFIFYFIIKKLSTFTEVLEKIYTYIRLDQLYLGTIMKMIGISYISEFAAGICKDTGYQTIGIQIELFAKLSIMALSFPVMLVLLQTIQSFLS